jgi:nucleoside-diphosphate-sugar epimerase
MKVLVTGGTGFIGSHLIVSLLSKGYTVRAIYRNEKSKTLSSLENDKVEWVKGDVLDIHSLENAMQEVDAVFHCAAMVSFDARQREQLMKTNVEGTANVVNVMLDNGLKKIVYLSSVAALGRNSNSEKIDEEADWVSSKFNSQYAISKYKSEMEVWRGVAEGLQAVVVNPGIVLGEGDWNKGSNKLFKNIHDEFPFYTNGITSFVDVKDVVRAMVLLFEEEVFNERFILSAGTFSYKKIFELMASGFNTKPPSREAKPWMIELVWRFYEVKKWFSSKEQTITRETARSAQAQYDYDNSKLITFLPGFNYTDIEKTIKRTCTFYMK